MTTYTVTAEKLQELNVIVGEQGGTIPTEVSNALAAMEVAMNAGETAAARKAFNDAVEANKKNGAAWSSVQAWHDSVRDSTPVEPPSTGFPESFPSRDAFYEWLPTTPQAVNLDGILVKTGFGPPANYHSYSDGTIHNTPQGATGPTGPTGPTEPPPTPGGDWSPIHANETRNLAPGAAKVVWSIQAADAGRISVEVSGSPPVEADVGPRGAAPDKTSPRYKWGAGTTTPVQISPGEWYNWRYDAPQDGQNMRPQLLP